MRDCKNSTFDETCVCCGGTRAVTLVPGIGTKLEPDASIFETFVVEITAAIREFCTEIKGEAVMIGCSTKINGLRMNGTVARLAVTAFLRQSNAL